MLFSKDSLVIFITTAAVVSVMIGFLAPIQGGNLSSTVAFTWHPILMTIAFSNMMVVGRWAYITDSAEDKWVSRWIHQIFMSLGMLVALAGYICILLPHLAKGSLFGYDYKKGSWASPARVAHGWIGYTVLLLVLAQVPMGVAKLQKLKLEERIFSFHGSMGKTIMVLATANMLIACHFWKWSLPMKIWIGAMQVLALIFGAFWPRETDGAGEAASLLPTAYQASSQHQSPA